MKRTITASHRHWLDDELLAWQSEGLIDAPTAAAINERYDVVQTRRLNLARLLLLVGAAFVGIGVIWLIAANLDELSPMVRLAAVFGLFAAAVVGAERLAGRRAHGGAIPSPVVIGMRLLATLLLGGVIFQAAQSLQVPAFEPGLLGLWAVGALLYAYLTRSVLPLLVGVATGLIWLIASTMTAHPSGLGFVLVMFAAALLAVCLSHLDSPNGFAIVWRETGAALTLVGLFAAAVPGIDEDDFGWSFGLVLVAAAAAVALAVAALRRRTTLAQALGEPLGVVLLGAIAVLLVFWEAGEDPANVDFASWVHAAVAVTVYVAAALGVAYLGIVHDSVRLTIVATAALVVFTTFQAFAVFAQIIQGAWLFVFLGLVLAGSGYLFDRARREMASAVADEGANA